MTYPYPADPTVFTQLLVDKIDAAKESFTPPVRRVFYGDQDRIPETPSVCVETGDKTRTLAGVPNMTDNEFENFIIIYHDAVQSSEVTRKEVDSLAYQIEFLLHQDLQLKDTSNNPTLIHGYVRSHESGYAFKKGTLYRAVRLTHYGRNKTSLPTA